jgi:CO/xanthine dehydrogenase Mo-binding subunit
MQSSAAINVNADGTISLVTGSADIGGTRVAVAMQAAEVLGLNAEDVHPTVADTDSIGWTGVTGGSRTAVDTGRAAIEAAEDIKRQMSDRAALLWEVGPEEVSFEEGTFKCAKDSSKRITFKELAARLPKLGGLITISVASSPRQAAPALAGNLVDLEVDPETGKVDILRFTVFQDVGRAVHPSYVEGQMQGGSVQGIGWALNEEYVFDRDGQMKNASFLDYRMPTSLDVPPIETVVIEVPDDGHPFGLRGVGEVSIVPPMAAVANAVHDATGVRMCRLPMAPATVLEALDETV